MRGPTKTLLELKDVHKSYGDVAVLSQIDLAITEGEFMTVLGPSGSGKTTILRLIGGFTELTTGAILLDGADISSMPINRRPFNTVFQDYALFPHMTVAGNVGYGLKVRGVSKPEIRDRVRRSLALVQLEGFADRYPSQLSGGQQQRVALARALICDPRLILLDEPLGALDAELRRQMQRFLKRLQREIQTTFLFVTHDQEEAVTMADRICVMNTGRIVQVGSPQEVYYRPLSEYVARFFGDNNLIEAVLKARNGVRRYLDTPAGTFVCATKEGSPASSRPDGLPAKLIVRPEAIHLNRPDSALVNRLAVRVEEINFVGPTSQVMVRALNHSPTTLMIKLPSRAGGMPVTVGTETEIGWSDEECHIVLA
jgi:spermidine/putrescine transport system ATP-binding protein